MNRRAALNRVSMIMGGTIVGAEIFLYGCKPGTPPLSDIEFTPENLAFLDEVGETILPETPSSPGAKAAKIGEFMKVMVTDCYKKDDQNAFLEGIVALNDLAKSKFDEGFIAVSEEDKKTFLESLDQEAKDYDKAREKDKPKHYFTMMKELTLWGYFSSEVGATQALRYVETPGRWEACIPYNEGDKAWAI